MNTSEKRIRLLEAVNAPISDMRFYDISGGGELTEEQALYEMIGFFIRRSEDDYVGRVWTPHEEYVLWLVARYDDAIRFRDIPGVVKITLIHDRHPRWLGKPHAPVAIYRMVPWTAFEVPNTESEEAG